MCVYIYIYIYIYLYIYIYIYGQGGGTARVAEGAAAGQEVAADWLRRANSSSRRLHYGIV